MQRQQICATRDTRQCMQEGNAWRALATALRPASVLSTLHFLTEQLTGMFYNALLSFLHVTDGTRCYLPSRFLKALKPQSWKGANVLKSHRCWMITYWGRKECSIATVRCELYNKPTEFSAVQISLPEYPGLAPGKNRKVNLMEQWSKKLVRALSLFLLLEEMGKATKTNAATPKFSRVNLFCSHHHLSQSSTIEEILGAVVPTVLKDSQFWLKKQKEREREGHIT